MNALAHDFLPSSSDPTIDLLRVEDTINTALNATLMVHDYIEDLMNRIAQPGIAEDTNTAAYAIGHARDAVRAAHDHFHAYLQQEFARARAAKMEDA